MFVHGGYSINAEKIKDIQVDHSKASKIKTVWSYCKIC